MKDLSFCVTAHDRPVGLELTILSLMSQKGYADYEILVGINSTDPSIKIALEFVCKKHNIFFISNTTENCWTHTEFIAGHATGRYLCFPSEADYYLPTFGKQLLNVSNGKLDLVFCDCLYDYYHDDKYKILYVQPLVSHIDKGGFIIKNTRFLGFPKPLNPDHADGFLIEEITKNPNSTWAKIPEVLWVHN